MDTHISTPHSFLIANSPSIIWGNEVATLFYPPLACCQTSRRPPPRCVFLGQSPRPSGHYKLTASELWFCFSSESELYCSNKRLYTRVNSGAPVFCFQFQSGPGVQSDRCVFDGGMHKSGRLLGVPGFGAADRNKVDSGATDGQVCLVLLLIVGGEKNFLFVRLNMSRKLAERLF